MLIAVNFVELLTKGFVQRAPDTAAPIKELGITLFLSVAATCLNPAGARRAIYPFLILKEYEFPVMENFSVMALAGAGFDFPARAYFLIVFGLLCLSWLYALVTDRSSTTVGNFLLSAIFSTVAWHAVRNFSLFAYFALPLIAVNLRNLRVVKTMTRSTAAIRNTAIAVSLTSAVLVLINPQYFFSAGRGPVGVGLKETNDAVADFQQFRRGRLPH